MRSVSIVIPSRNRPRELMRCLMGVAQLSYPKFEVIVVACPKGCAITKALPNAAHIKICTYDDTNLSVARNLGIAEAAGDIVAFLDDDAVPEPQWLNNLVNAFEDGADAVGGTLLTAGKVVSSSTNTLLETIHRIEPSARLHGANLAVRREVLSEMNGFDPAFRFQLSVADLQRRLEQSGHIICQSTLAQVHHDAAENDIRHANHVPKDLYDAGFSFQIFSRKHLPMSEGKAIWHRFWEAQRRNLFRWARRRKLNAGDISSLMQSLQSGGRDGLNHPLAPPPQVSCGSPFLAHPNKPDKEHQVLGGWMWQASRLRKKANGLRNSGAVVTLVLLSPTWARHSTHFSDAGIWEQRGGLFGPSELDAKKIQFWRVRARILSECERVKAVRGAYHQD